MGVYLCRFYSCMTDILNINFYCTYREMVTVIADNLRHTFRCDRCFAKSLDFLFREITSSTFLRRILYIWRISLILYSRYCSHR